MNKTQYTLLSVILITVLIGVFIYAIMFTREQNNCSCDGYQYNKVAERLMPYAHFHPYPFSTYNKYSTMPVKNIPNSMVKTCMENAFNVCVLQKDCQEGDEKCEEECAWNSMVRCHN